MSLPSCEAHKIAAPSVRGSPARNIDNYYCWRWYLQWLRSQSRARGLSFLRPINVKVSHRESNVAVQVFGLGTVEARVTSKIGFKVSGVVVDLRADIGDRIARARFSPASMTVSRARGRRANAIEQAEANLQRATAGVEKTEANYTNTKTINERRQKLLKANITSLETAETAQAAQDAALADVSLAQAMSWWPSADISDAKAQQQHETAILEFHTLAAPYGAMVTARPKELGSALGAGEPVFTLIDPKSVWVLAYIDESKAGEITVGDPAEIVLRSRPSRRLRGHIARIEPESDRVNEERRVEVAFETRRTISISVNRLKSASRPSCRSHIGTGGGDYRAR